MNTAPEKVCYLVGFPLSHSLSPGIHGIIYKRLGLNWQYRLREIEKPEDLEKFTEEVENSPRCAGFNVTIPYKTDIIKFLDGTDSAARQIGAVNTVISSGGKLKGANTDWEGFLDDLKETLGFTDAPGKVLILGAGGASRAVVYALARGFSSPPRRIYVYDIRPERAEKIKEEFKEFPLRTVKNKNDLKEALSQAALLVNATPAGMKPAPAPVKLQEAEIKENLKVYDLVYNRETELIKQAMRRGLKCSSGAGMLASQGAKAFQLWSCREVPGSVKEEMTEYVKSTAKEVRQ